MNYEDFLFSVTKGIAMRLEKEEHVRRVIAQWVLCQEVLEVSGIWNELSSPNGISKFICIMFVRKTTYIEVKVLSVSNSTEREN